MRTTDPNEAERLARAQKAMFDRQEKEVERLKNRDKLVEGLPPADRDLLAAIGGLEQLLTELHALRTQVAFLIAGKGAHLEPEGMPLDDEYHNVPTRELRHREKALQVIEDVEIDGS